MRHYARLLYGSFFLFLGIALAAVALTPSISIAQDDQEEAHKEVIRRIVEEGFNQGNVAVIDELVAEDYVSYSPGGVETENRDDFKASIEGFRAAMPDLHATADPIIAEGEWVAFRFMMTGTFQNELTFGAEEEPIPPTGQPFTLTINILARFNAEGQLVEEWNEFDLLSFLGRLGVLPPELFEGTGGEEGGEPGAMLDGEALVNERCTVCHTRERIDAADKDEAGWTETVDRMITNGAVLNAEERQAVIDYLVATH